MFQSTHPRGVRHGDRALPAGQLIVSIHAPAWGATQTQMNGLRTSKGFQSTHPRGVRLFPFIPKEAGRDVSIHAPAWGATGPSLQQSAILQSFNPRTRVGCDPTTPAVWWPSSSFNPRTRVGCDLMPRGGVILLILFQSTHPRGVRPEARVWEDDRHVFQSTHPRGVRPCPRPA